MLAGQGLSDAEVQTITNKDLGQNVVQISAHELGKGGVDGVTNALRDKFGLADNPSTQQIGASFGQSVAKSAIYAIIASLIVIGIYITLRFQWKFAVPVLIALTHDLLITGGVYALVGREVTASTVAALLTILGFSLYDTIVVFDRVRENIPRMPNAAFSQIYNRSMSEVIVRSLATSFCAALPILALLLFGGDTLKDFAFALLVGTLSGTYSSVFIAGPVLTHWKEREPVYKARERRIRQQFGGEVPPYAVPMAGRAGRRRPEGAQARPRPRHAAGGPVAGRLAVASSTRWCAISGSRKRRSSPRPRARGARPAAVAPARGGTGTAPAQSGPPQQGPQPDDGGNKPKKPRNRRHGRPR